MEDCIFCKIAEGKINSEFLYEDEDMIIIRDINPCAPVHMLVMPKRHIASIAEMVEGDANLLGRMALAAKDEACKQGIAESGYRLVINTGPDGGQTVEHLHMHLIGGKKLSAHMA